MGTVKRTYTQNANSHYLEGKGIKAFRDVRRSDRPGVSLSYAVLQGKQETHAYYLVGQKEISRYFDFANECSLSGLNGE